MLLFSRQVVSDSTTPWTAACQASLSPTISQSLPKFLSIASVMPANHLILCGPLLLLPSIFPSIRVFSNESKFWWHCGGVNGDLLQEGLCYTQVCCTQSSCCCSRLLLTHTSAGDTQTLKGRSGSVSGGSAGMHKVLFEFSERNGILF